jgi:hypothetical protein
MPSDNVTSLAQQPLSLRCLALTGTFETSSLPPGCFGSVAGDFDGQGISYSALQWNLGQGTLQPLLLEMIASHADVMGRVLGDGFGQLSNVLAMPRSGHLAWARSIQTPMHTLVDPWHGRFQTLGQTAEFQTIAVRHAAALFDRALALCRTLAMTSQRAAALMFDIEVQNGGIAPAVLTLIESDFARLASGDPDVVETAKMRIVANRIADTANIRWREDVRVRKLAVADGTGVVHGVHYDLAGQFGLTMARSGGA